MIDLHNHILYGVDDGCSHFSDSLSLLKDAQNEGINTIVFTPHFIINGQYREAKENLIKRFETFKEEVKQANINIDMYLGQELFIHKDLDKKLAKTEVLTLANSHYLLVEFPFDHYEDQYDEILHSLKVDGYIIIIAHPERYHYVRNDPNFCLRWLDYDHLLQVNQDSIVDSHNNLALKLIEKGFISFVSSDAHDQHRPLSMKNAYHIIVNHFDEKVANDLFINNPTCVINDQKLINTTYQAFKKGFFGYR